MEEDIRNNIVEELSGYLFGYVMKGSMISSEKVADSLSPDDAESFEDLESMLNVHYLLEDPEDELSVYSFVDDLHYRLRRIKTDTRQEKVVSRGSIEGKIDWNQTIKQRCTQNPDDKSVFVYHDSDEYYNIDENKVLLYVLEQIESSISILQEYGKGNYDWIKSTWKDDMDLADSFQKLMKSNVHLKRIRAGRKDSVEQKRPSERKIRAAEKSRQSLYREAATLLRRKESIEEHKRRGIEKLLSTTIIPDEDTLYELYVAFKLIDSLKQRGEDVKLKPVSNQHEGSLAEIELGKSAVKVYHDTSGGKGTSFSYEPSVKKEDDEVWENVEGWDDFSRPEKVELKAEEISLAVTGGGGSSSKRPDVLLDIENPEGRRFVIIEVKNSSDEETIRRGIKEILEYRAYLRVDGGDRDYFYENPIFDSDALLVTQDFNYTEGSEGDEVREIDENYDIEISQFSNLGSNLEKLVENIVQ